MPRRERTHTITEHSNSKAFSIGGMVEKYIKITYCSKCQFFIDLHPLALYLCSLPIFDKLKFRQTILISAFQKRNKQAGTHGTALNQFSLVEYFART